MTDFANNVFGLINQHSEYWRTDTDIPKMSDLKFSDSSKSHGKIQLIRRFDLPTQVPLSNGGLGVTSWGDNSDNRHIKASPPSQDTTVIIQDHYNWVPADGDISIVIGKKFNTVKALMIEASSSSPSTKVWYFNYTSAVRNSVSIITPFDFAHGTTDEDSGPAFIDGENFLTSTFLKTVAAPKRYGVLMVDYPTDSKAPDLILQIVQNNIFRP